MNTFELAQLNIAVIKAPLDSPRMADFVNNLAPINALADGSPGFVWRLQSDEGNATTYRIFDDKTLVNLSVWEDIESLRRYVYSSEHADYMRRRREWFEPMKESYMVLWWVPRGHRPTIDEAAEKLDRLRHDGPSAEAFTFRNVFYPPNYESSGSGDKSLATRQVN